MADYDIFISYKSSDDNGLPTRDSAMAESLYHALVKKGYKTFFSKYSITNDGRSDYITLINDALESSKILIAVGTTKKNLTSRWVKREINIFSALMMNAEEGAMTIISYRSPDLPVSELPANLADLQSYADESSVVCFIDTCLQNASGFHKSDGDTVLLYEEENTHLLDDTPITDAPEKVKEHLLPGDVIDDRYTVVNMIGKGGMSYVHLAMDKRINKVFAIKEIRKNTSVDFSVISKSLHFEFNLMKQLNHPAIPSIFDIIETSDSMYIVMDYVEGENLQVALNEYGAEKEEMVIDIALQLCNVLRYLHTLPLPVIFRDLKPANVILQPSGNIKLVDFGTARQYKPNATGDTVALGTKGYAAPEQYGGMGQTDARTDIYNLGVTLYHLVTNKSPMEPPYVIMPIRKVNPKLSKGLEYIIKKCTQKDPEKRFQSAKELSLAIRTITKYKNLPLPITLFLYRRKCLSEDKSILFNDKPLQQNYYSQKPRPQTVPQPIVPRPIQNNGYTVPQPVVPKPVQNSGYSVPQPAVPKPVQNNGYTVPQPAVPKPVQNNDCSVPQPAPTTSEALLKKISNLDPEAKQIVETLIDRLTK